MDKSKRTLPEWAYEWLTEGRWNGNVQHSLKCLKCLSVIKWLEGKIAHQWYQVGDVCPICGFNGKLDEYPDLLGEAIRNSGGK